MVVASYGGGVNSTAMLIAMADRGETVDLVLFADTGGERPETYEYVRTFSEWLQSKGYPAIHVVRESRRTLEQECLEEQTLPSIVVGFKSCSDKYKIRPQNRFMAEVAKPIWERGGKVTKLVGFDAGEAHRVKNYDDKHYTIRYPLVEWLIDRDECKRIITNAGLPMPPKSSCFFCPNMKKQEIIQLSIEHPDLYQRALKMEGNNTKLTSVKGLKRTASFRDVVEASLTQCSLFVPENDMPCGCID